MSDDEMRDACRDLASGLAARRALRGELVRLSGGHCAAFMDAPEPPVAAEMVFLRRYLLGGHR